MNHAVPIDHHGWRDRAAMAAAATATLVVILGSSMLGQSGPTTRIPHPPEEPPAQLTDRAMHALVGLPLAYQSGDAVIAPVATDDNVAWSGPIADGWIIGHALPMGSRGLLPYAEHELLDTAPAWAQVIQHEDRVFSDVGPIWFACVSDAGKRGCTPALLMYHDLHYYPFVQPLGSSRFLDEGAPMEVHLFDTIDGTRLLRLVVGGVDGTAVDRVWLSMADGSQVAPWISRDVAVAGDTVWWTTVSQRVLAANAYDADGNLIATAAVADQGGVLLSDYE